MGKPTRVGKTVTVQKALKGKGFEPDAVGKAALDLLEADEKLKAGFNGLKIERKKCEEILIDALHKSKRKEITIEGRKFELKEKSADEFIKIKKPRLKETE